MGGAAGLLLAFFGMNVFFAVKGWPPVFDVRLAPVAVAIGAAVASASGTIPAYLAARVQPADTLRVG